VQLTKINIFSLTLNALFLLFTAGCSGTSDIELPDFQDIQAVQDKSTSFFPFIVPITKDEKTLILKKRNALLSLEKKQQQGLEFNSKEQKWLSVLSAHYKIKVAPETQEFWTLIKKRVDFIPLSALLVQDEFQSS